MSEESIRPPVPNQMDTSIPDTLPDLSPARWIWYPSGICQPCTFVLFRREVTLSGKVRRATGWISADSRYLLTVNGQRIQWGPAPCDPRWLEADPVDLTGHLHTGTNVFGATVCYFGHGDGTWTMGKPGFLFRLEIETEDGNRQFIVSNAEWQSNLCRAWQPGHYKRFFVRALQEEFDTRKYPHGWNEVGFRTNRDWLPAMELNCPSDRPAVCSTFFEHIWGVDARREICELRPRTTALLREYEVPVSGLTESMWLTWKRPCEEYFECLSPNAFTEDRQASAVAISDGVWDVELDGTRAAALTFELPEQVVGWPRFTIEAPEGTTVELLVHEAHQPGGPALLNTHFQSWTRFVCQSGKNQFETFDYESCRWVQLHIHNGRGKMRISGVGVRRRVYPWPNKPRITCSEPALQDLMNATINTLNNSCQETCVDGMARERQQYSGDCGHQLHALYLAFGETRLAKRFITTYSQGMTPDGYFLDCWPAYDRLVRLMERATDLAWWGPLLDHGVGFNFDCWHHYLYTADLKSLEEPYPRLRKFAAYLQTIRDEHGLLKVDNLGIPCVWIDHIAYQQQRHKQCAFNLYAAAMLQHAWAPICEAFGHKDNAIHARAFGQELLESAIRRFWSNERNLFVANLPWREEEKETRLCDRSLATSILFDQCPGAQTSAAERALETCPAEMGLSYPANANWRLWALTRCGRGDVVLKELRKRWATMESVRLNNTLQEDWQVAPDSGSQWSHCPVSPLFVMHMSVAGIRPLVPGFKRCEIRPQLADLEGLQLTTYTVQGPIDFQASGGMGNRELNLSLPRGIDGELVISAKEEVHLDHLPASAPAGWSRYRLPAGQSIRLQLKHT